MIEFEQAARVWFQSLPLAVQLTILFGLLFLLALTVAEMNKAGEKLRRALQDDEDSQ